jgi:phosphoglycolate phosphatase
MKKYKAVIFDMDGTLADTLPDIADCMNRALAGQNLPPLPLERYSSLVGHGVKALARGVIGLDEADAVSYPAKAALAETLAAAETAEYNAHPLVKTRVFPAIPPILDTLKMKKMKLAVLTNKQESIALQITAKLFPLYFDVIRGGRDGSPNKPDPRPVWDILMELGVTPSQTVFVGDSEVDIQTARNAGCFPLAVSWGYRPLAVLKQAGAAAIVNNTTEFLDVVLER